MHSEALMSALRLQFDCLEQTESQKSVPKLLQVPRILGFLRVICPFASFHSVESSLVHDRARFGANQPKPNVRKTNVWTLPLAAILQGDCTHPLKIIDNEHQSSAITMCATGGHKPNTSRRMPGAGLSRLLRVGRCRQRRHHSKPGPRPDSTRLIAADAR